MQAGHHLKTVCTYNPMNVLEEIQKVEFKIQHNFNQILAQHQSEQQAQIQEQIEINEEIKKLQKSDKNKKKLTKP